MKRIALLTIFLLLLAGSATAAFNPADYTDTADFYVNSTSAQTDYSVMMILDNRTDTPIPGLFYTGGKTRPDWLDVAWTDTSDNPLGFWRDSALDTSTNSTWWMNVSSIANDNTTEIRLRYGDADAAESYEDAVATFNAFYDFTDGTYTGWTVHAGTWSAATGELIVSTAGTPDHIIGAVDMTTFALKVTFKNGEAGSGMSIGMVHGDRDDGYSVYTNGATGYSIYEDISVQIKAGTWTYDYADYHTTELRRDENSLLSYYLDGESKGSVTDSTVTSFDGIILEVHSNGNSVFDNVILRKCIAAEPFLTYKPPLLPPVTSFVITLTDTSTNTPISWQWNATNLLGNNTEVTFSTDQNPVMNFGVGNYLIKLTATNAVGSNSTTKTIGLDLSSPQVYFWNRTA